MEGKNSCRECRIGPQDERNNWHCGKWKSRSRPTSTALVVQRIHGKQKKNGVNNRAIQFVKEGNISKTARKNMRQPSLLEGCTDWHVATDLKHNFIFPTEIALTTKRPDIVIWSVKAKKVFVIELTVPFEENFNWAHQRKLEKYEDLREQWVRNG